MKDGGWALSSPGREGADTSQRRRLVDREGPASLGAGQTRAAMAHQDHPKPRCKDPGFRSDSVGAVAWPGSHRLRLWTTAPCASLVQAGGDGRFRGPASWKQSPIALSCPRSPLGHAIPVSTATPWQKTAAHTGFWLAWLRRGKAASARQRQIESALVLDAFGVAEGGRRRVVAASGWNILAVKPTVEGRAPTCRSVLAGVLRARRGDQACEGDCPVLVAPAETRRETRNNGGFRQAHAALPDGKALCPEASGPSALRMAVSGDYAPPQAGRRTRRGSDLGKPDRMGPCEPRCGQRMRGKMQSWRKRRFSLGGADVTPS